MLLQERQQDLGDPDDTRAVRLALTDEGRSAITAATGAVRRLQEELTAPLGGLKDPKTVALIEALHTLLDSKPDSKQETDND